MNIRGRRLRGRPIYIKSGDTTISLVPEITSRRWSIGSRRRHITVETLRPSSVYVINADDMYRLDFRDWGDWLKVLMFVAVLLAPLPLRFLIHKSRFSFE